MKRLTNQGLTFATHAHIISKWYRNFRKHRKFQLRVNSKDLSPFLHANPDICMNIQRYGKKENLDTLSIEMLSEYIHDKDLPALVHSTFNEPVEEEEEQSVSVVLDLDSEEYKSKLKQILITHGLTCISPSTVYRWMTHLGFRYAPRRKGYYVDGHEKPPATIQCRWDFCKTISGL